MRLNTQFITFVLIGTVNTAIHYSVFILLFRVFGLPMLMASGIGYCMGVLNSFIMNRKWTFQMPTKANMTEFGRFVLVNLFSLLVNMTALHVLVRYGGLVPEIGQAGAIGASIMVNFTCNKCWTFRQSTRACKKTTVIY